MSVQIEQFMSDKIVQIEPRHLPAVAVVHARAFPDSALTRLGLEAVRRYYEWQLQGPHEHHFIAAFDKGDLLGFAVGGTARGALAGFVRKNKWFLTARILLKPRLILSERGRKAIASALEALKRLRVQSKTPPPHKVETQSSFGILAIAVDPACQGKGIGLQLMERFERIAREHHLTRLHLTVSVNNTQAIRFYEKLGWTRGGSNTVWNGFMEKRLS
jgi:ribosomal protein S18 acetylase RimI-like enzyme